MPTFKVEDRHWVPPPPQWRLRMGFSLEILQQFVMSSDTMCCWSVWDLHVLTSPWIRINWCRLPKCPAQIVLSLVHQFWFSCCVRETVPLPKNSNLTVTGYWTNWTPAWTVDKLFQRQLFGKLPATHTLLPAVWARVREPVIMRCRAVEGGCQVL